MKWGNGPTKRQYSPEGVIRIVPVGTMGKAISLEARSWDELSQGR